MGEEKEFKPSEIIINLLYYIILIRTESHTTKVDKKKSREKTIT